MPSAEFSCSIIFTAPMCVKRKHFFTFMLNIKKPLRGIIINMTHRAENASQCGYVTSSN